MDAVVLDVGLERVNEQRPDDVVRIGRGEYAGVRPAERVAGDDERPWLPGRVEQRPQVRHRVAERVRFAIVTPAASRPVVRDMRVVSAIASWTALQVALSEPEPASSTTVGLPLPRQSRYSDRCPMSYRSPFGRYGGGRPWRASHDPNPPLRAMSAPNPTAKPARTARTIVAGRRRRRRGRSVDISGYRTAPGVG